MTFVEVPYGKTIIPVLFDGRYPTTIILPPEVPANIDPQKLIENAIDQPLDGVTISTLISQRDPAQLRVAIAINDKTRPVPHDLLLPPLLSRLEKAGILPENIVLLIATGTHIPMPAEEFPKILPADLLRRYPVRSHNCDDQKNLVYLGKTQAGTPVSVNRYYYEADIRMVVGNIEPHHFMGFSGGAKSASIGVTGRETINTNHAMLTNPLCRVGEYESNPMRMDVEEIGRLIRIDFALNLIPNREKGIVYALAGNPISVMQAGVPLSRAVCQVEVKEKYDLVIASAGGYPKDINLYQAQKGLTHASLLTKDEGLVILVAECIEGSGSTAFEQFMEDVSSIEDVFTKFSQIGFRVGPHKAFQIAREAARIQIMLKSTLPNEKSKQFFMMPVENLQKAIEAAIDRLDPSAKIAVLPRATSTIPLVTVLDTIH